LKRLLAAFAVLICLAAAQHEPHVQWSVGTIAAAPFPYVPGSVVRVTVDGFSLPYTLSAVGAAWIEGGLVHLAPNASDASTRKATVIAAERGGLARHTFRLAAPPDGREPFIAVASYDDGVIFHQARAPFAPRSALGIGGAAADVAISTDGNVATATTDGETAIVAHLRPWSVQTFSGVPFTDELAFDDRSGALFATDRDVNGAGAITRITPSGAVSRRVLGLTSEGLAVDAARGLVYVANVNDGTVSVVDAATLVERRRFHAVGRVFSLALSRDGSRLYAVSNQSIDSPFAQAGRVVAIDVRGDDARRIARSGPLPFPVGIALDERHHRVYVTDESADTVSVLDARTLAAVHPPLRTCDTPWKPTLDDDRLYIPCARSNEIDVFDATTLERVPGAPFRTGGYPLAVAVWHGDSRVVP
jgi:hypothetical protein